MIHARWLQQSSHPLRKRHRQVTAASITGLNVCVLFPVLVYILLMDHLVLFFSQIYWHILEA